MMLVMMMMIMICLHLCFAHFSKEKVQGKIVLCVITHHIMQLHDGMRLRATHCNLGARWT